MAFFFKQWGGVRKDLAGRMLNGRTYGDMPAPSRPTSLRRGRLPFTPRQRCQGSVRADFKSAAHASIVYQILTNRSTNAHPAGIAYATKRGFAGGAVFTGSMPQAVQSPRKGGTW